MTDDVDMRRRRALYRAMHRGTKEMDHLVGRYADACLASMAGDSLGLFERFLALPDPMLQAWIFEPAQMAQTEYRDLVADMRRFHGLDPGGGMKS